MICQILFSEKKYDIIDLSSAELAQTVEMVNFCSVTVLGCKAQWSR